jgi:alkaline phosphatase D
MKYPEEHKDFMNFIDENKIPGLIFISGDRHYSELMKLDRENNYPLYEFTCSPLTSFMDASYDKNNPIRVKNTAIKDQNFGRIKVYPKENDWICSIEEFDTEGKLIWKQEIKRSELKQ